METPVEPVWSIRKLGWGGGGVRDQLRGAGSACLGQRRRRDEGKTRGRLWPHARTQTRGGGICTSIEFVCACVPGLRTASCTTPNTSDGSGVDETQRQWSRYFSSVDLVCFSSFLHVRNRPSSCSNSFDLVMCVRLYMGTYSIYQFFITILS